MKFFKMTMALVLVSVGFLSLNIDDKAAEPGLTIGKKAPEIRSTLLNGSYFNLEDMKGKMILIDFWASYDAESRIENHQKNSLIDHYGDKHFLNGKGFEIVSISLDRFKTPLVRAIEADQLNYPLHICDYKGKESKIVQSYQANAQKKYLIDGDGRIVAVVNSMDQIEKTLQRLMRAS
jgi:peroxiredoxin